MHVIGTAGHVDHGKSTLVERLTGIDPDRFAEEKRRGLTIDLGFAWLTLPSGQEIGIIDVPGHERFIRNMLAGAGGTTVCLFVVAANEGWKRQSAEHLAILDVLGTSAGIVALTKKDLVDEETLELRRLEIATYLEKSSLRGAPIVACSATSGEGMDELVDALDSLIATIPDAPDRGRPRLWVDRVFTIAGAGTVVTGTLGGGSLAVGDEVAIAPEDRHARIRSIQSHKKDVASVAPGNRTALNLAGLERAGARRGDAIVQPGAWHPTRRIHALIRVLDPELSGDEHALREKGAHLLYAGTAETPVKIRLLEGDRIEPGTSALAQLDLREPLPLERGDNFVLRDAGRVLTFGGGKVVDPWPTMTPRDRSLVPFLRSVTDATSEAALRALVEAEGTVPVERAVLRTGVDDAAGVTRLGTTLISDSGLAALAAAARETVERHHAAQPLQKGIEREELRVAIGVDDRRMFEELLVAIPDLVAEGPRVRLADHSVRLDPAQQGERDRLVGALEANGLNPPLTKELDFDAGLLRALSEDGEIVRVGDFYLTRTQVATVHDRVRRLVEQHGAVTVAQIRDALGTSRKYAVPLCEWLDQTGFTRRQGDVRVLGPRANPA